MSDSGSSFNLPARMDREDDAEAAAGVRNNGGGEKHLEFDKLLRSMIDSQATSLDEEDAQLDDVASEAKLPLQGIPQIYYKL